MASLRKIKLPSGKTRYKVEYKDADGNRRAKNFSTYAAGDKWRHRTFVEVEDGVHIAGSQTITIREAGKLWLQAVEFERERRPVTLRQYKSHLDNHICNPKTGIGNVKLNKLTAARVKRFYQDLVKVSGRIMADKVLKSLKSIISEAQVQGKVKLNVALPVKPYKKHTEEKRATIPPLADVRALLDHAPAKPWKPYLYVAAMCGLRGCELRALQWAQVDLENGIISVTRSADHFNDVYPPKSTSGIREVPVPRVVIAELKKWKLACPVNAEDLVFPNKVGKVMASNCLYQNYWADAMADLGFVDGSGGNKFTFHDLRHVAASLYIKSGAQPKKLSVIMGHSSIKITFDLYGHLWEDLEGDQALAQGVQDALFSGGPNG